MSRISSRLQALTDQLPLFEGIRVLEIGCGPGSAAREISCKIGNGHILGIDRSEKAIELAIKKSTRELQTGILLFQKADIENFKSKSGVLKFDLAFAIRVGVLDGRYPLKQEKAIKAVVALLKKDGRFFVEKENTWLEIPLTQYQK